MVRDLRAQVLQTLFVAAMAVLLCGCKGVDPHSVTSFRDGVAAVQKDSATLLLGVNRIAREAQLDRAAQLDKLAEDDVAPALDTASVGRWNQSFESLQFYASALEVLLSSEKGTAVETSLKELGARIKSLAPDAPAASDELANAIARIGKLVVNAAAGAEALAIMQRADPDVRQVLTCAADIIGGNPADVSSAGVRKTIFTNWTTIVSLVQAEFTKATESAKRRAIAEHYADLLDSRAAGDSALAALRNSLLALADAHTAASQGRSADAAAVVASLREQVKFASELTESARKKEAKP